MISNLQGSTAETQQTQARRATGKSNSRSNNA